MIFDMQKAEIHVFCITVTSELVIYVIILLFSFTNEITSSFIYIVQNHVS